MGRSAWLVCASLLVAAGVPGALAQEAAAFTLASTSVKGGAEITLTFPGPLAAQGARYWVCLVKKGEADSTFGVWAYVDVGATSAKLTAPEVAGDYEVRLHSGYPEKSCNVVHRVAITVSGLGPTPPDGMKLVLAAPSAPVDRAITVRFPGPLVAEANERFWVALVMAGAPDEEQGLWAFVPAAAGEVSLPAPTASGEHEVRLHANYPTRSTHVVHRLELDVTGGPETRPTDTASVKASLAAASIAHGTAPTVTFNVPLRPRTGERFWISLAAAALPEGAQGLWTYIEPGATSITLEKPVSTGAHRIELHANYPKSSRNMIAKLDLAVTGTPQQAPSDVAALAPALEKASIAVGEQPVIKFGTGLLPRTGERFWVTVIEAGKADSEWGKYVYVELGATEARLPAVEAAGSYEVRLHSEHPTKSSNVVTRLPLTVK